MSCTHLAIEERRSCVVPTAHQSVNRFLLGAVVAAERRRVAVHGKGHTNLMATCWLFKRLVPSKITPKEPSPIFFPTR